jgi:hypothetical protein
VLRICSKCGLLKGTSPKNSRCKDCRNKTKTLKWALNRDWARKQIKGALSLRREYRLINEALRTDYLLSHPCKDCGNPDIRILDMDHIVKNKLFCISQGICQTPERFKQEMAKCESRCRNCHRIKHWGERKERGFKSKDFNYPRKEILASLRKANSLYKQTYLSTHSCVDCGCSDVQVLDFDHVRDKSFAIAKGSQRKPEVFKEEVEKCEIRCANCHQIRHWLQLKSKRKEDIVMKKTISMCDKCGIQFSNYSMSIRAAATNIELKLVPTPTEEDKVIGPFDLCKGCMKEIFKGIKVEKGDNVT